MNKVRKSKHHPLEDTKQSKIHLSAIQLILILGLPVLSISIYLTTVYGLLNALINLAIGNILIYLIRFGLIYICKGTRDNSLDVARKFFGQFGSILVAIFMLGSLIGWFVEQTSTACTVMTSLLPINEGPNIDPYVQWSVYLGILSTVLCIQGMKWVRKIALWTLPIMLCCLIFLVILAPPIQPYLPEKPKFSLSALPLILGTYLSISSDLPTFFRHSRSWKASKKALIIIQVTSFAIGILGCFLTSTITSNFGSMRGEVILSMSLAFKLFFIILVLLSTITANIANIYAASVAWEIIAPILSGTKEYLILGLGLTSIFVLIANLVSMKELIELTDYGLINFCLAVVVGFLFFAQKNRNVLKPYKGAILAAWIISSSLNITFYATNSSLNCYSLLIATLSILATLGIFWLFFRGIRPIYKEIP